MNYKAIYFLSVALFLLLIHTSVRAENSSAKTTPTPTPTQITSTSDSKSGDTTNETIVVHKPATDPTWGKIIQLQQEQAISPFEHTKETLYKFLFQDDHGVIRLATYHESSSGTGYWEVWVWDQP